MEKKILQTVMISMLAALLFLTNAGNGTERCEWVLNQCPGDIDGQVIVVPSKVIALSSVVNYCNADEIIEVSTLVTDTPAIMFVIDNSGSMVSSTFTRGNDNDGTRFTVTRDLLDTIYAAQPQTWVGLVVFSNNLYFDHRTHDILVPLDGVAGIVRPELENQSYLPPLKLDSLYMFDGALTKGIDILRYFLKTSTRPGSGAQLDYKPQFSISSGTNINSGFAGALQGFEKIPEDIISKDQRYIVFLSDGEPQPLTGRPSDTASHGGKPPYYFKKGINTPTTFTVFLHNTQIEPPDSLIEMTENIRNNGYSGSNEKSDIWILKTSYDTLMSLFMQNIIQPILSKKNGTPTFMTVNGITSNTIVDSTFAFSQQFSLTRDTSKFTMEITYRIVDAASNMQFDTSIQSHFTIVRDENAGEPVTGLLNCWNRDLALYYNGSPVYSVDETMNNLQVVFSHSDTISRNVNVQITNTNGPILDEVHLSLIKSGQDWKADFIHEIGIPVHRDPVLQHENTDSIVLIYRSNVNPLDTIRKSYPFSISRVLSFPAAYYYDSNADGIVDSMFLEVTGTVKPEDISSLQNFIKLPGYRNFIIQSINIENGGLGYKLTDPSGLVNTTVNSNDIITIDNGNLPAGGILTANIIFVEDRVAPVIISGNLISSEVNDSLQVVFSEPVEKIDHKMPILFSLVDGTEYLVELEANGRLIDGKKYTVKVISVQSGFSISTGDSIWINPTAGIGDQINTQANPANRRVAINVQETPFTIVTKAINNPLKPTDQVPDFIRSAYEQNGIVAPQHGLVIVVEPKGEILRSIYLQGTASIYDVVKNPIVKNIPGVFDKVTQKLYYIWDGTNSRGRLVATGTYSAILRISDTAKKLNVTTQIPVGIKRKN